MKVYYTYHNDEEYEEIYLYMVRETDDYFDSRWTYIDIKTKDFPAFKLALASAEYTIRELKEDDIQIFKGNKGFKEVKQFLLERFPEVFI